MNIYLETARLFLREFTEDDADNLLALDNDPDVLLYIGTKPLLDREAYRQLVLKAFLPYHERGDRLGYWAALEKGSGTFIGWFHLKPAPDYRFAKEAGYREGELDVGYRLRRAVWGKGFATEGALALVDRAFDKLNADGVVATTLAANVASRRVLEKAGLKRLYEYALPGYDVPAVKYGVSRLEHLRTGEATT